MLKIVQNIIFVQERCYACRNNIFESLEKDRPHRYRPIMAQWIYILTLVNHRNLSCFILLGNIPVIKTKLKIWTSTGEIEDRTYFFGFISRLSTSVVVLFRRFINVIYILTSSVGTKIFQWTGQDCWLRVFGIFALSARNIYKILIKLIR